MTPELSIVVPLYNKAGEIARCIRSVLAQTFSDFELIVINDGSTDASASIVETIRDERLRFIHQANQGLAGTRNNGVREARATLVVFLDADDEWLPDHLENIRQLAHRHPEAGIFFSAFWVDRGREWRRPVRLAGTHLKRGTALVWDYFSLPDGYVLPSATAVRKEAMLQVGGYRKMFGEDIDLNMRMAAAFPVAYSSRATSIWHVDAANRMCVDEDKAKAAYVPGSLSPSLQQIAAADGVSSETKKRAAHYLQRREERVILRLLIGGDKQQAKTLYAWWKQEFGTQSPRIAFMLQQPEIVLKAIHRVGYYNERGHASLSYALHRRHSLRLSDLIRSSVPSS